MRKNKPYRRGGVYPASPYYDLPGYCIIHVGVSVYSCHITRSGGGPASALNVVEGDLHQGYVAFSAGFSGGKPFCSCPGARAERRGRCRHQDVLPQLLQEGRLP